MTAQNKHSGRTAKRRRRESVHKKWLAEWNELLKKADKNWPTEKKATALRVLSRLNYLRRNLKMQPLNAPEWLHFPGWKNHNDIDPDTTFNA